MKVGYLALIVGGIGLIGCAAAFVAIWLARPPALQSSAEILDATDDALILVEERTAHAGELVTTVRAGADPVLGKILKLADKTDRTPDDDRELSGIAEELADRLRQVDSIAQMAESAVALLNKTSRLRSAVKSPIGRSSADERDDDDDSRERGEALARAAANLKDLRKSLTEFRESRREQRELADAVVRIARNVETNLISIDTTLRHTSDRAATWRTEVEELQDAVPKWINWAAVIGSVVLAWMGLGQVILMRWARARIRVSGGVLAG